MPNQCDIVIAGHAGNPADTRFTSNGSVTSFSIAYNPNKNKVIWFKCTAWGERLSEKCTLIEKGTAIKVYGRITGDHWVNNEGMKIPQIELTCEAISVLPKYEAKPKEEDEGNSDLPF